MPVHMIRLALREEGPFWNAYLAPANTMDGAELIGSIAIGAVKKNPEVRDGFLKMVQLVLADAVKDVTGEPPIAWDIHPAPEAERSGHG